MAWGMTVAPSIEAATRREAAQPRDEAGGGLPPVGRGDEETAHEADGDDDQQADDDALEGALGASLLDKQQADRDDADDAAPGQQRQAEEQVEGDRPSDHLGQVGRDGDELGLEEEGDPARRPHPGPQSLGQRASGDDAELGALVLDEHGHGVGQDEHPHQQVTVAGAGGDVGGHVPRVYVGHGGHEGRSEQRQETVARWGGGGVGTVTLCDGLDVVGHGKLLGRFRLAEMLACTGGAGWAACRDVRRSCASWQP